MAIYVRDEKGVLQAWEIPAYKGEKGEAGITPNLQIGDVVTLEPGQQATVVRRGDDENPIFDFAIPKGEDGENGIFVGSVNDAPEHAQIIVNDDPSPYDLFYEDANVSYMGDTYTSLKEKADADIEYLLRKFGTQHYEGISITATDTYAKQVKNAMLKGQTLVNLIDKDAFENNVHGTIEISDGHIVWTDRVTGWTNGLFQIEPTNPITSNKDYTLIFKSKQTRKMLIGFFKGYAWSPSISMETQIGINILKITSTGSDINFALQFDKNTGLEIYDIILLEGDYTSQNIPYFEGMCSVKPSALKTTGKNLFDKVLHDGKLDDPASKPNPNYKYSNSIKVKGDTAYYWTSDVKFDGFIFLDVNKNIIDTRKSIYNDGTVTTPSNCEYVVLQFFQNYPTKFQFEEGNAKTTHEDHKSSSISLPEEVILRSLPNKVCDTFNTLTGEHVKRIEERLIDGNALPGYVPVGKDWVEGYTLAHPKLSDINMDSIKIRKAMGCDGTIHCDKLGFVPLGYANKTAGRYWTINSIYLILVIPNNELTSYDTDGIKEWLNKNSLKFQYELDEPIITTIDLQNQKIYSYDGTTYYTTSSVQGHPAPILSIDVPTNTTKMIARQREEIEQQEQKLQEQEEVQNALVELQLAWYEEILSTLELSDQQQAPSYIQKLYELSRKNKAEEE